MPTTFMNAPDEMKWLRDVHLPGLSKKYKSAVVYGNEDWPDKVEVFTEVEPSMTDKPVTLIPKRGGRTKAEKHVIVAGGVKRGEQVATHAWDGRRWVEIGSGLPWKVFPSERAAYEEHFTKVPLDQGSWQQALPEDYL